MSEVDFEAEYNNRAKVPGHPAVVAGWQRDAAAFRAAWPRSEFDLAYGPTERQALDLFWPDTGLSARPGSDPARTAPIALFLHGGYWQGLDRSFFSHMASGLLGHGVAVAVASYDLCPAVTLAEIVAQAMRATQFLAARHQRPALAYGHSAGGHLAAMLLAEGAVQAALALSGLFDLVPLVGTSINTALGLDAAEAKRLSPLSRPRPEGRIEAVVGGQEGTEYLRQSRTIAKAWSGAWEAVPGENHFNIIAPLADPGSALVRRAVGLIGR